MRVAKTAFNETLLKKMAADPACRGNDFTDAGCRNLVIYIAKDGVVTFTFRKRVKGAPKGRVFEGLGTWSSAFTLADARDECAVWRTKLSKDGYEPKAEKKTVFEAIPIYETKRKNGDPQTSRVKAPLPEKWDEHRNRFKVVFADLLPRDIRSLRRDDFMDCMDAYGRAQEKANAGDDEYEWDWRVLRPMMVHTMPMLRWFTKRYRLDPGAIEDIVPPDYDKDTRYLLPGEWQACAPHVDSLTDLDTDCGLFERFVLYTCVRSEQALRMQWDHIRWGQWSTWRDDEGREHRALIWIPPRKDVKSRSKKGGEKLPRTVLLTGETLTVLERLRAIWEENRKNPEHAHWNGVFPERVVHRWRTARTDIQRRIEKAGGTQPWDRMTLRHTHATYLGFLGCPQNLISLSMNHTPGKTAGAADVTDRYNGADPVMRFMKNEPLAILAPWHLRLHKLIRDIERGNVHAADLTMVLEGMRDGQKCKDMCEENGINPAFIEVEPTKLRAVQ
jgi:integrase